MLIAVGGRAKDCIEGKDLTAKAMPFCKQAKLGHMIKQIYSDSL